MKTDLQRIGCALGIIILLLIGSCGRRIQDSLDEKSQALVAYPGAQDVKVTKSNGSIQLEYRVDEKFPAPNAVDWVRKNLEDNGWEKLPGSYFNPQVEGVKIDEWVKVIDARDQQESVVYQKSFDWKDVQNNILVYGFEYRYPRRSQPMLQSMHVRAILIPADLAKAQMEAGQKALKALGGK